MDKIHKDRWLLQTCFAEPLLLPSLYWTKSKEFLSYLQPLAAAIWFAQALGPQKKMQRPESSQQIREGVVILHDVWRLFWARVQGSYAKHC